MSAEQNEALARRFFAEQDRLRGGPAAELCAPAYTVRIVGAPPMDLAGHTQFSTVFYGAFPDMRHTIDDTVADERQVAVRFTIRGTHTGDFMGIPASGKPVEIAATAMLRVEHGQVVALHGLFDQLGLLQQLGAIPTPEQAG